MTRRTPALTPAILEAATDFGLDAPTLGENSFGIPSVFFPGIRGYLIWSAEDRLWYLCAGFERRGRSLTKAVGGMIPELALLAACNVAPRPRRAVLRKRRETCSVCGGSSVVEPVEELTPCPSC